MREVEKQGRTVEEAIENALKELNAKREEVEITVIEEGSRGIFGILSKQAKVKVRLKERPEEKAVNFVKGLLQKINIFAEIETQKVDEFYKINIKGKGLGILIGKHGETLNSLQYLVNLVANKGWHEYIKIIIDVENYREKREKALIDLAIKMAKRVKDTKKSIKLEPMPPYERKIIHKTLQNDPKVKTHSEGEEPFRRVVISLK
ncbi:MAG: RNA-binding cell elongation regulator Jag/EloR [Thermovenabulum sp.]|uniref:RNA-binding cell elongation regulator Jag/EloR n=1 Tax=Thermovenabulum sp. TaxID=3100335 RepID=UPI003C7BEB92